MKFMLFEGSTAEFKDIAPTMGLNPNNINAHSTPSTGNEEIPENPEELSVQQIKSIFTRRPLRDPMKAMLRVLYKAGEERISSEEIREQLGYTSPQFRGMLGAFGRRRVNTNGVPDNVKLWDEQWNHDLGQKTWTLPHNVRTALEQLKLV